MSIVKKIQKHRSKAYPGSKGFSKKTEAGRKRRRIMSGALKNFRRYGRYSGYLY